MVPRRSLILPLILASLCLGGAAPDTKAADPEATVRELLGKVRQLAETSDKAEEARLSRQVSAYFDVQGICKACLRKTWTDIPEAERKNVVALFQEHPEKVAYPKSSDCIRGTEGAVEDSSREGEKAEVDTVVMHPEEGMVEVGFSLKDVNGSWRIEDIDLDGVSLVLDLRSQMQKIISDHSYDELKKRMREKLEESDA